MFIEPRHVFNCFFFAVSIDHNQEDESDQNSTFCQHLTSTGSFAAIADLTWGGWDAAKLISAEFGIPYIRIEVRNIIHRNQQPIPKLNFKESNLANRFCQNILYLSIQMMGHNCGITVIEP